MRTRYGARHDCAGCGRNAHYYRIKARRSYGCEYCGHQVYPTAGTPFERTRTSLRDWFFVLFLMTTTRNGVAAKRVERELGVTYKTAWRMCHLIREYMGAVGGNDLIGGEGKTVQIDETFVGGRFARGHRGGDPAEGKATVFGMLEVGGAVVTHVVPNRTRGTIFPLIKASVAPRSQVHTDEYRTYDKLGAMAGMSFTHDSVNHRAGQYVSPTEATVNALEGLWAALKRGINGTHIHVSEKHLPKYLAEFQYRWNMRQTPHLMLSQLLLSFPR